MIFQKSKLFGTVGIFTCCVAGWAVWMSPADLQSGIPINEDLPETTETTEFEDKAEVRDLDLNLGQDAVLADGIEVFDDFSDVPIDRSKNQKLHAKDFRENHKSMMPGEVPFASKPFKDATLPGIKEIKAAFQIEDQKAYDRSLKHLSDHLQGKLSPSDRKSMKENCERVSSELGSGSQQPGVKSIGCLFYVVQKMHKEDEAKEKIQRAALNSKSGVMSKNESQKAMKNWKKVKAIHSSREWNLLADFSYELSLDVLNFKSLETLQTVVPIAISTTKENCKTAAASAALIRNLENFLPSETAWKMMTQVYEGVQSCLKPGNPAYEPMHGRMALIYFQRREVALAGRSLELALLEQGSPDESRYLFWRGYIESIESVNVKNDPVKSNIFWQKLVDKYPLTLHALVTDEMTGIDSYDRIKAKAGVRAAFFTGKTWDKFNLAMFTYILLNAEGEKEAARRFNNYMTDRIVSDDFESGLGLALLHVKANNVRSSIAAVFSALKRFGSDKLNADILNLMYPSYYRNEVLNFSGKTDPALVLALMRQESSFNPRAKSRVGAMGLMQVLPRTANFVNRKRPVNLFDPSQNIRVGSLYLGKLLSQYDENFVYTLAAYNAGPSPVSRWRVRYPNTGALLFSDLIPYPETRSYVAILLRNMHWYREILAQDPRIGKGKSWTAASLSPTLASLGIDSSVSLPDLAFEKPYSSLLNR